MQTSYIGIESNGTALRVKSRHRSPRPTPALAPGKRRAFFLIMIAIPFLAFALLEGVLRVIHYGPDLSLFTTEVLHGKTYTIMNPAVKSRYFYRVQFSPTTSPDYFLVPKPPGTYRIFCLGGSTTVGFPYYYNTSFSSFLRERLRRIFPDRRIEIINIGMTATNSYTALDMMQEVVRYEPDLVISYDGHNEFYGALGVASRESLGSARWLSLLSLRMIHLRTFLLLRDTFASLAGVIGVSHDVEPSAGMMEKLARGRTIPYDSPLYRAGFEVFRDNIAALRDIATSHGIPLIVGTQVSNLRDLRPFVSGLPADWTVQQRSDFQNLVNGGLEAAMTGRFDSALAFFQNAVSRAPRHAEAHYYIARTLDTLRRKREAENEYRLARDYDELRFRTSSQFNDALRALDDGQQIACADMEEAFRKASPDSLIGRNLILEHLHPNASGYFLLAKEYARVMRDRGFIASSADWASRDTVADEILWHDRPMTELDERIAARRTDILTASWPFAEGTPVVEAIPKTDTLGLIAEQVTRARIYWHQAHWDAVKYYEMRHDVRRLEREYRTLISQLPYIDVQPYVQLARLLLDQDRIYEVRDLLLASLDVQPTILAFRALGDIALNMNQFDRAAEYYEKTFTFPQTPKEQVENGHLLALSYFRGGNVGKAMNRTMKVLELKPDYLPAVKLMQQMSKP
jgi:tetratricopeptide (TPR) repeat protein